MGRRGGRAGVSGQLLQDRQIAAGVGGLPVQVRRMSLNPCTRAAPGATASLVDGTDLDGSVRGCWDAGGPRQGVIEAGAIDEEVGDWTGGILPLT